MRTSRFLLLESCDASMTIDNVITGFHRNEGMARHCLNHAGLLK